MVARPVPIGIPCGIPLWDTIVTTVMGERPVMAAGRYPLVGHVRHGIAIAMLRA